MPGPADPPARTEASAFFDRGRKTGREYEESDSIPDSGPDADFTAAGRICGGSGRLRRPAEQCAAELPGGGAGDCGAGQSTECRTAAAGSGRRKRPDASDLHVRQQSGVIAAEFGQQGHPRDHCLGLRHGENQCAADGGRIEEVASSEHQRTEDGNLFRPPGRHYPPLGIGHTDEYGGGRHPVDAAELRRKVLSGKAVCCHYLGPRCGLYRGRLPG